VGEYGCGFYSVHSHLEVSICQDSNQVHYYCWNIYNKL